MEIQLEKSLQAQVHGYVGRGVLQARVEGGHLLFTMTDGSQIDLGQVAGQVALDSSLTQEGMAPDAGAVGQRLGQLEAVLGGVQSAADQAQSAALGAESHAQEALSNQGQLSTLETGAKGSLVAAINEVNNKSSGRIQWTWVDLTGHTSIPYALLPNETGLVINLLVRDNSGNLNQFWIMNEAGQRFNQAVGKTFAFPYSGTTLRLLATSTGFNINCTASTQLVGLYYAKGTMSLV